MPLLFDSVGATIPETPKSFASLTKVWPQVKGAFAYMKNQISKYKAIVLQDITEAEDEVQRLMVEAESKVSGAKSKVLQQQDTAKKVKHNKEKMESIMNMD